MFGWPIHNDPTVSVTPTYSGGVWEATLPLTNLSSRKLHKVARSTDDALTSTIVKVDLGVARDIRLVAIPKHNLSTVAKARVRLFGAEPFVEDNDFNGWTSVGTPVVTTGQADPMGGTRATLIEDNDGAAEEGKYRLVSFTGDGTKVIALTIEAGTAAHTEFGIFDVDAVAWRHLVRATWSGGTPTLSSSDGSGTLYTPTDLGGGMWQIQFTVPSVVAANANRLYVFPAGNTAANTGTAIFYEAMAFNGQIIEADSGVDDAWPSGLDLEEATGINVPYVHILSTATSARYVRVELADTANADGYVELGRLVVAGGYQPTINMNYGARLGLESDTIRAVTDGGAAVYQEKAVRRVVRFTLDHIEEAEAFASAWQLQRRLSTSGQVFFIWNPDDGATLMHERAFLGVLRQLHGLDNPFLTRHAAAFEIVEEL